MSRFTNKVVLVTGALGGIGQKSAGAFATGCQKRGCTLWRAVAMLKNVAFAVLTPLIEHAPPWLASAKGSVPKTAPS